MPSPSAPPPANRPKPAKGESFRDRVYGGIARWAANHPYRVVLFFLGLAALGAWYIQDFPIRTAYLDLLPQDDPLVEKFRRYEQEAASTDVIVVLLTLARPPESWEERTQVLFSAADRVLAALDHPDIRAASYKLGAGIYTPPEILFLRTLTPEERARLGAIAQEVQALWPPRPPTFPAPEELEKALTSQDPPQVRQAVEAVVTAGRSGRSYLAALPQIQALLAEAVSILRQARARGLPQDEGYPLLSADRTRLVIQVWPTLRPYESLAYNRRVVQVVRSAIADLNLQDQGITVGLAGPYVGIVEADQIIRQDMGRVTLISSAVVLALVLLTFSGLFIAVVALLPMAVSIVLTMAWAKLAVGGFNLITMFLPALVLGLGIDYTLHLLFRYTEERAGGKGVTAALTVAVRSKGEACWIAALTTAAVFACLLVSHSRALWEMGVIMALGILFALVAALFLTPAVLALVLKRPRRVAATRTGTWAGRMVRGFLLREEPLAQPQFFRTLYRRLLFLRWGLVAVTLALTGALTYQAVQVQFKFASSQLTPPTPSAAVLHTITREFAGDVWLGDVFKFFVETPEEIPTLQAKLLTHPLVVSTRSVRDLLPQELVRGQLPIWNVPWSEAQAAVVQAQQQVENWGHILVQAQELIVALSQGELWGILAGHGALAQAFAQGVKDIYQLLEELEELDVAAALHLLSSLQGNLDELRRFAEQFQALPPEPKLIEEILSVLPEEVRTQYRTRTGLYIVEARLQPALHEGKNLQAFLNWADALGVERFGVPEVTARLEAYMKRDFALATALAVVVIVLLVFQDFRSLRDTLLVLSPLALGYVWMLAGMRLMGIQFNFTNIVISPLLIGIGVDSAVHMLHRVQEEHEKGADVVARAASSSLVPILASSLTTMTAFAALLVAQTPGLRFLGASALLGLGFTLVWSLTFLPAAASLAVEKTPFRE